MDPRHGQHSLSLADGLARLTRRARPLELLHGGLR